MDTIANGIKKLSKENGLKMYELANVLGITQASLYNTYMHSTDQKKLDKVAAAIDSYKAAKAAKAGAIHE